MSWRGLEMSGGSGDVLKSTWGCPGGSGDFLERRLRRRGCTRRPEEFVGKVDKEAIQKGADIIKAIPPGAPQMIVKDAFKAVAIINEHAWHLNGHADQWATSMALRTRAARRDVDQATGQTS
eukprot:1402348-Pyramimonas_sp.AAC.1